MKQEWKSVLIGTGVSFAVCISLPLLYGYLMLRGSVSESAAFACAAAAAGLGAAAGMATTKGKTCAVPTTLSALLIGPAVQALLALIGFLVFPCGVSMGERRWLLPCIAFLAALISGALLRPKRKKRRKKKRVSDRHRT